MAVTISREMTITHKDFFRLLPKALKNKEYFISGRRVTVSQGECSVNINLSAETGRQLGALVVPVIQVEIIFTGYSEVDITRFLQHFDLAYQKGGG